MQHSPGFRQWIQHGCNAGCELSFLALNLLFEVINVEQRIIDSINHLAVSKEVWYALMVGLQWCFRESFDVNGGHTRHRFAHPAISAQSQQARKFREPIPPVIYQSTVIYWCLIYRCSTVISIFAYLYISKWPPSWI